MSIQWTQLPVKELLLVFLTLISFSRGSASESRSNLWQFNYHLEEGGEITMTTIVCDLDNPPSDYDPTVPDGTVTGNWEVDDTSPSVLMLHTPTNGQIGMKYTAGYYRGPLFSAPASRVLKATGTNYVSIFSNKATSKLIAAVDQGLIYTSTNAGMTWNVITAPGSYELPLATAADGSGIYVHASIKQSPSTASAAVTPLSDWYTVASSEDGSKLVITSSASQPAPMLNIRYSKMAVIIGWPAAHSNYTLECATDLSRGTWTAVTNAVQVLEQENRVVLPPAMGNHFFRLKSSE
jgi:hypothetical protein